MESAHRSGRPPKGAESLKKPISVRLPPAMDAAIEAIQARRLDAPDKSDVIRELIAAGLERA